MNKAKGQTLLEVIIATAIISFGFVGIMTLVVDSLSIQENSRERVQATFIAQEGIDMIVNRRDTNLKDGGDNYTWNEDWFGSYMGLGSPGYYTWTGCCPNQFAFAGTDDINDFNDPAWSGYTYEFNGTRFYQYLHMQKYNNSDDQVELVVRVTWGDKNNPSGEVKMSTILANIPVSFEPAAPPSDPNWIAGVSGTPLEGKWVYKEDLLPAGIGYWWGYWNWDCVSPYCQTGLDPNYPTDDVLSFDNGIDFNTGLDSYPARHQCKIQTGGRMPTVTELESIYWNREYYGNNFNNWGVKDYWSANEISAGSARFIYFDNVAGEEPWIQSSYKDGEAHIRCVKD